MKKYVKKKSPEIPILILVTFIPIIIQLKIIEWPGELYTKYINNIDYDIFSYYKMGAFLILTAVLLVVFLISISKKYIKVKSSITYIFLAIYTLFVVISALLSPEQRVSLFGFYCRYEGLFVLLSYIILFFVTYNVVDNQDKAKKIISALTVSSFIIGIIGLTQFINHDILKSQFGKSLIVLGSNKIKASDLVFTLENHTVYSTLFHSNYVGSFIVLILPLFILLAFKSIDKGKKIEYIVLSIIMFICLFGSRSRAGMIGAVMAIFFAIILFRKYIIKRWKLFLPITIVLVSMLFVMDSISGGTILKKYTSLYIDPRQALNKYGLEDVKINKDNINIKSKDETLKVYVNDINNVTSMIFKDRNDKAIEYTYNIKDGTIVLNNERYKNYKIQRGLLEGNLTLIVAKDDVKLYFRLNPEGIKFINPWKQAVDLKPIEKWGFEGKEQLGSCRGYIWSRSIPLLKDTLIVGNGPDTFAINFPQEDYIGKLIAYGTTGMFVDKPHNMYLQIAINTGVVSLIALLLLFLTYIIQSLKLYSKSNLNDYYSLIGTGIFLGIIGYLFTGLFNDSVISVAPIFWLLLGIGMSFNGILIKKEKEMSKK